MMANDRTADSRATTMLQPEPILGGLKKLFASLLNRTVPGIESGAQSDAPPSAISQELNALYGALRRIDALISAEEDRAEELTEQLKATESERIDVLTAERLLPGGRSQHLEALSTKRDGLRGQIADAEAVANKLREERIDFAAKIDPLNRAYRAEVEAFLTVLYGRLMTRYAELAPEVAAAVLQVAAVRRAMISRGIGNSNGWSGEVFLPGMKPGDGTAIPPILAAGSPEFNRAVSRAESEVLESVRAAGYLYGIDFK